MNATDPRPKPGPCHATLFDVTSYAKKARRGSYTMARFLGDLNAVASGKPDKIVKRQMNRWIGRNVVNRMWLR